MGLAPSAAQVSLRSQAAQRGDGFLAEMLTGVVLRGHDDDAPFGDLGHELRQPLRLVLVGPGVEAPLVQQATRARVEHGHVIPPPSCRSVGLGPGLVVEGDVSVVGGGLDLDVHRRRHTSRSDGRLARQHVPRPLQAGEVQTQPVETQPHRLRGQALLDQLPALGQRLRLVQRLAVEQHLQRLRRSPWIAEGSDAQTQVVVADLPQWEEEFRLRCRGPVGRVAEDDLVIVPAGAAEGQRRRRAQVHLQREGQGGLPHAVGAHAVLVVERLWLQRQHLTGVLPGASVSVLVGPAAGNGRQHDEIAHVVKLHQLAGLSAGGRIRLRIRLAIHLHIGHRLEERDAPEVLHLERRGTGDVAADDRLAVHRLIHLNLRALGAEGTEGGAPAQRQLHHGELPRLGPDLFVDRGHSGVGQRRWQGCVLEQDNSSQQRGRGQR